MKADHGPLSKHENQSLTYVDFLELSF